jgi:glycosyltransferase involved in cell wall biosynthesis
MFMKSIGLLISTLNGGGAERVVSHLSYILGETYNIHLILFNDDNISYNFMGTLHVLDNVCKNSKGISKLRLLRLRREKLRKIIDEEKLECVISFLDSPNIVNILANKKLCKTIVSVRNYSSLENSRSSLGLMVNTAIKVLYRRADRVVTVSKMIEQDFHKNYRIPASKICTIYNPYNFDEILKKSEEPLSPDENTFFEGHFVFAFVGRIVFQKGVWHLIKAFSLAHQSNKNIRLCIVGEDYSNGQLSELIKQLGVENEVLCVGRSSNPYKYLGRANAYVLTSLFEGFPNAMVEAMVCKCAIIASDCKSGPREILFTDPNLKTDISTVTVADYGIIVPNLDQIENWDGDIITDGERNLATSMRMLGEDRDKYMSLAAKAYLRSKSFDYDTCYKGFVSVIED